MKKIAVIMAGGTGSRLWPLSRQNKPKQFMHIGGNNCLLSETIMRVNKIIPPERCFVVTNHNFLDITREMLKGLISDINIILEPSRKNTAACIAYSTLLLQKKIGPHLSCFIPADGYVMDISSYTNAIKLAYQAADSTNSLVIIGVKPTYPATGYGYMQIESGRSPSKSASRVNASKVLRFVEKPDPDTAANLVSTGKYLWNCGILVGKSYVIASNIKTHLPGHFVKISQALRHIDSSDFNLRIGEAYGELQNISFDNGVLEKCKSIYAVKGEFDWDDIGNIDSLSKTIEPNIMNNHIRGKHLGIDTCNSVILSDGTLVATLGVNDMIIAATKDAILVCPRNKSQKIKNLVDELKLRGFENHI